jgi:hypothetical protein
MAWAAVKLEDCACADGPATESNAAAAAAFHVIDMQDIEILLKSVLLRNLAV